MLRDNDEAIDLALAGAVGRVLRFEPGAGRADTAQGTGSGNDPGTGSALPQATGKPGTAEAPSRPGAAGRSADHLCGAPRRAASSDLGLRSEDRIDADAADAG